MHIESQSEGEGGKVCNLVPAGGIGDVEAVHEVKLYDAGFADPGPAEVRRAVQERLRLKRRRRLPTP